MSVKTDELRGRVAEEIIRKGDYSESTAKRIREAIAVGGERTGWVTDAANIALRLATPVIEELEKEVIELHGRVEDLRDTIRLRDAAAVAQHEEIVKLEADLARLREPAEQCGAAAVEVENLKAEVERLTFARKFDDLDDPETRLYELLHVGRLALCIYEYNGLVHWQINSNGIPQSAGTGHLPTVIAALEKLQPPEPKESTPEEAIAAAREALLDLSTARRNRIGPALDLAESIIAEKREREQIAREMIQAFGPGGEKREREATPRPVSLNEARDIALDTLHRAEQARRDSVEREAAATPAEEWPQWFDAPRSTGGRGFGYVTESTIYGYYSDGGMDGTRHRQPYETTEYLLSQGWVLLPAIPEVVRKTMEAKP